jgi:hypothetical protein
MIYRRDAGSAGVKHMPLATQTDACREYARNNDLREYILKEREDCRTLSLEDLQGCINFWRMFEGSYILHAIAVARTELWRRQLIAQWHLVEG